MDLNISWGQWNKLEILGNQLVKSIINMKLIKMCRGKYRTKGNKDISINITISMAIVIGMCKILYAIIGGTCPLIEIKHNPYKQINTI